MKRGRWVYYADLHLWASDAPVKCLNCPSVRYFASAWQLEDTGWWLRRRTGAKHMLSWCGYCLGPPYARWMLLRVPPCEWLSTAPKPWYVDHRQPGHGTCTHQYMLADAMRMMEKLYDEKTMKALAAL